MSTVKSTSKIFQTVFATFFLKFILFTAMSFIPQQEIMGQDQNAMALDLQDKSAFITSHQTLEFPVFDTMRPTLIKYGKGLVYYESLYMAYVNKQYSYKHLGEEKSLMRKSTFSDMELDIMKQNLLFIEEQYKFQIKEWIRKEKLDLNLGEAIKGFYQTPLF